MQEKDVSNFMGFLIFLVNKTLSKNNARGSNEDFSLHPLRLAWAWRDYLAAQPLSTADRLPWFAIKLEKFEVVRGSAAPDRQVTPGHYARFALLRKHFCALGKRL
jgi:hypothetical protein